MLRGLFAVVFFGFAASAAIAAEPERTLIRPAAVSRAEPVITTFTCRRAGS